jgi:hypothetical protein
LTGLLKAANSSWKGGEMACKCPECSANDGPNKLVMRFKIGVFFAQYVYALLVMLRKGKFKEIAALIGAFGFFFTVPRRMICGRCDNYGKMCYSLYLGKVTSMIMPKVEGKQITNFGIALELSAIGAVAMIPAWAMRKNIFLLMPYMAMLDTTLAMQFLHACRHCGLYAEDWRKDCPSAKMARRIFEE